MSDGFLITNLPAVLRRDRALVDFLRHFDETAEANYERAGAKHLILDPATAPDDLLPWLGAWLGLQDHDSAAATRRDLIASSSTFATRGTAAAVRARVEALASHPVTIDHHGAVATSGAPRTGRETLPESPQPRTVRVETGPLTPEQRTMLHAILVQELPAGVSHRHEERTDDE